MKALENRTLDSKREMDIMAALDELRSINARNSKVSTEAALAALQRQAQAAGVPEEDFIDVSEFYALKQQQAAAKPASAAGGGAAGMAPAGFGTTAATIFRAGTCPRSIPDSIRAAWA
jgi:hypothetical protein